MFTGLGNLIVQVGLFLIGQRSLNLDQSSRDLVWIFSQGCLSGLHNR